MSDLMFERAAEDILQEAGAAELALHAEAYGERWIVPGSGSITGRQVAGIAE